jgi:hypothetical protein
MPTGWKGLGDLRLRRVLTSDIIPLVFAAIHAAAPSRPILCGALVRPIKPGAMEGTLEKIGTWLLYEMRQVRHVNDGKIAVGGHVAHAAAFEVAAI